MPEGASAASVCPYLRGRYRSEPNLAPSDANACVLAAFIYLPKPQQSRYCLGGQHLACARFVRQQMEPLPRYLTGIPTAPPPERLAPAELPTLWWRRRAGKVFLRLIVVLLFAGLIVFGWHWRSTNILVPLTPRPPLPTAIPAPTLPPPDLFSPPTAGPPAH